MKLVILSGSGRLEVTNLNMWVIFHWAMTTGFILPETIAAHHWIWTRITINNNSGPGDEDLYLITLTDTILENKCPEINAQILSEKDYFCEGNKLKLRCEANYGNSFLSEKPGKCRCK